MPSLPEIMLQVFLSNAWILVTLALCAIVFTVIRAKASRIKGWAGEKAVRSVLTVQGIEHLHDVYLPSKGGVTQIDHIALVGGTILMIETKNYEGAIYPQHGTIQWTQSLARGKVKNRFQSPLQQNQGHLKAVRAVVGPGVTVEGLVVFAGGAVFPKGRPEGVLTISELPRELKQMAGSGRASPGAKAAWSKLMTAHAMADRGESKKVHMETVARAKTRGEPRKAA